MIYCSKLPASAAARTNYYIGILSLIAVWQIIIIIMIMAFVYERASHSIFTSKTNCELLKWTTVLRLFFVACCCYALKYFCSLNSLMLNIRTLAYIGI